MRAKSCRDKMRRFAKKQNDDKLLKSLISVEMKSRLMKDGMGKETILKVELYASRFQFASQILD